MPISAAAPRQHLHHRSIEFHGYRRDDGLWDIEAELKDRRDYAHQTSEGAMRRPGDLVHNMLLRVTVDDQMTVRAIETGMPAAPFAECTKAEDPMQKLVGVRLGSGWRRSIERAIGGIQGCTHMRELLFNMATAAYQTIPVYLNQQRREQGLPVRRAGQPPPHFGQCMSWDFDGPVVQRVAPEFFRWKPPAE